MYDVRLRKDGYEPLSTQREAEAPIYEYAPIDLALEAAPLSVDTKLEWHFELKPRPPLSEREKAELIERGRELREETANPT